MKSLVCAFVLLSVASLAMAEDDEARTIYSADGGLYYSLNDTTLLIGLIGLGVLAAGLYAIFLFTQVPPAYEKQGHYYDPDLAAANSPNANAALAYAVAAQQQQYEYRQKRSAGVTHNLATRMQQLESVFKKFEVEAEECQEFIACEAAQLRKLKTNVPVVQIVNRIMSTADDKIAPRLTAAFQYGLEQQNQPRACYELRQRCYVAHNNQ